MPIVLDGTNGVTTPVITAGNIVGQVCFFGMTTPPTGFLSCNGAAVSRATYASLFAAIGTTYGAGNGSTTFAVPDLRGEFVRGLDDGRGIDPSRAVGSAQAQEVENHGHPYRASYAAQGGAQSSSTGGFMHYTNTVSTRTSFTGTPTNTQGQGIGGSGGVETRPRNVALLACIKF